MSDPTRIRDLSAELDTALDDPQLDPPDGIEEDIWNRLESSTSARDTSEAVDQLASTQPPKRSPIRFVQAKVVIGAFAVAAVALLALRGPTKDPAVASDPSPVTSGPTTPAVLPPSPVVYPPLPASASTAPARTSAAAPPSAAKTVATAPTVRLPVATPPRRLEEAPVPPTIDTSTSLAPAAPTGTTVAPKAPSADEVFLLEGGGVAEAQAFLRAGNGSAALSRLSQLEGEVPGGTMREERDSLRIEALVLLGRTDQAASAAAAFAEAHPKSPLLHHVRQVVSNGTVHGTPKLRGGGYGGREPSR